MSTVNFSVPVSEEEKKRAKDLRSALEDFSLEISKFLEFFSVFTDSLEEITDGKELIPISDTVIKFVYKMRSKFNDLMNKLSRVLFFATKLYSEPKTDQAKEVMMSTSGEARIALIELIRLCDDLAHKDFVVTAKELCGTVVDFLEKSSSAAHDEWISHIDRHILGRSRLL